MASSISVAVRVRPFSIREAAQLTRPDDAPSFFGDGSLASAPKPTLTGKGMRRVVKVIDEKLLVFDPAEDNPMARYQKTILPQGKRVKDMRFGFDRVFDETCTQQDVYEATTKSLLGSVLEGYNATVFAYGATGCGKTHTISGNPKQPGIIFLTCAELFERIDALQDEKEIALTLSYLEIYNETIRDLLVPGGSKLGLQLREDTNQNISVPGLSSHTPRTVEEVMDMIVMGNSNRTQSPTDANATSSRSHAVLQINVIQKPRTAGVSESHMASTLSIIDLAGSERASVTKNRGDRLLEGANINRSLLALGNCINSLCDPSKKNHIPYRDSKLTRLLKFSLGGNCKTVMIVCVSPSSQHYDETHNTLKYANRAKNIKTKVSRNIINVNRHVSEYVKAIYNLRQEVETLKNRLKDASKDAGEKINKQRAVKDASIKEGIKRLKTAYEQTKPARDERIQMLQSLRLIERRISLVSAWKTAFDQVFESRQQEEPPMILLNMRAEADKVLRELQQNERLVKQRLSGPSWERTVETALQHSLRNLQLIEGVTEADLAAVSTEANILRVTAERDVLQAMTTSDVDISTTIQTLSRAHFETYVTISKIMDSGLSEGAAMEETRKSLFKVQQGAGDAISHIVKPSGELVSHEVYQPPVFASPKKKHSGFGYMSPVKAPTHSLPPPPIASPVRSPRHIKAKSPKKGVMFPKKSGEKKRVRWNDELEDPAPEDRRFYGYMDDEHFNQAEDEEMMPPPPQPAFHTVREHSPPPSEHGSQGVTAPPIRPRNGLVGRSLAAKPLKAPPPLPSDEDSHSPLHSFDAVENVLNRQRAEGVGGYSSSEEPSKPWRNGSKRPIGSGRSGMRKSVSGNPSHHGRLSQKRRSPTSSSQSLTHHDQAFVRRLPKGGEKENGSMTSVLSPKSTGIKASARRMTVTGSGAGVAGINVLAAVAGLRDIQAKEAALVRESLAAAAAGGKKMVGAGTGTASSGSWK